MFSGSSKLGRSGGRGGGGSGGRPARNRNSFPPPTNRQPSPVGRMSSGGGGSSAAAPRQRNTTSVKAAAVASTASRTVEETFSLVPRESPSAFGMIIRLTPDLVEEIKRVEAQGETAKIKFDAFPNNSTGNIIDVGGKEFRFTWSRECDLCDIYEENQSGEYGNGVLIEAGCAWRKLNVQRTLDESTTSHMKMRSIEAERKTKSRKAIVLDPGNPSLTKQLALVGASPWRMSNKQKKEPPPKKRKVDPRSVPIGGPKPSVRPGASTPAVKSRLSASPGPSPSDKNHTSSYGIGNIAKTLAAKENVTPVHSKGRENMVASEKDPSTSGRQATNFNNEIDLQTLLVDLLKESPMSLKELEKAVGDRIPNAPKKIVQILKKIANFQAPRYFLISGPELESHKKHSPDIGSSPEHQQILPTTECSRDQLPVPGGRNMEKISVCERNREGSQDCFPVHLAEQLSAQENVDINHRSPGILHEEKRSENREGQVCSSSDSDNSDSGSDSGSSSDSEASSNSNEGSDEDVDIMSDGEKDHRQTILPDERDGIDLPGHGSNAIDIEGHDSDDIDIDGRDSDAVDIDAHDSDAVDINAHDSDAVDISCPGSDAVDVEGNSELVGNEKDPKNVSGFITGSSPLDSQISYSTKLPKGNGPVLQKQVSELELGELPEPLGEDTALKQLEEKSSYKQSDLKPSTSEDLGIHSDKRRSKKSDSKKPAPSHARDGIKELPEHIVEDSERSHKGALHSHGQNLAGTYNETSSKNKNLEGTAYKSRQKDSRARVGSSLEGYGEMNKKTPITNHGSKRASISRSASESRRHKSSTITNSINGHKDATSIPRDSVVREKRMQSFPEEELPYLKYEKASPELKGPISDPSQYEAYMQEFLDKYDSYSSVNKILESHRNNFQKLGQDLGVAKGMDMERYNKMLDQIKEAYYRYGERHKRLKKVFVVLHEELKQLKQRVKRLCNISWKRSMKERGFGILLVVERLAVFIFLVVKLEMIHRPNFVSYT